MAEQTHTPVGNLLSILTNIEKMKTFRFSNLLGILVDIWMWEEHPMRKNLVDYVIICVINLKDIKGITRMQFIELTWLLVSPKAKRASIEVLTESKDKSGLNDRI